MTRGIIQVSLTILLWLVLGSVYAQNEKGILKGTITEKESGESLIGASVVVVELGTGATTDLDGNFNLKLEPGIYTIRISYISFRTVTVENLEIKSGESEQLNIALETNSATLDEAIVEATQVRSSEVAILSMQRKSASIQDGISSDEMSAMGISDAANALTQVTGSAIEDGKYLVVRGLGDRYSLSLLDGIVLPSVDPLRNSTSLDLIPSGMMDNVVIKKTFSADLPGSFSGGLAEVTTKSIPDEFYLNAGISFGFNTNATFNSDFRRDQTRSSFDWLGYDAGARELPSELLQYAGYIQSGGAQSTAAAGRQPQNEFERDIINVTSDAFSTSFVAEEVTPMFNHGADVSFGNRYKVGESDQVIGLNVGLNYGRDFEYLTNGVFNTYETNTNSAGEFTPNTARQFDLNESTENVETGAMVALSYQINPNNRFTLKNLYNHRGSYNATSFNGFYPEAISSTSAEFFSRKIGYNEKMLNFSTISGEHHLKNWGELDIDWTVGYNLNQQNEPDLRLFAYVVEDGSYSIRRSETAGDPRRFFRELTDNQLTGKVDFSLPVDIGEKKLDLKWGGYYWSKERDFSERYYDIPLTNANFTNPSYVTFGEANGNFDQFFADQNMGFVDSPESNGSNQYGYGNIYREMTIPSNQYMGNETIIAGYFMGTYKFTRNLQLMAGLRIENTDLTTQNEGPAEITVQDPLDPDETVNVSSNGVIKTTDLLPTANLVYNINENSNLRAAYSQTLARPNMREISPFRSLGSIGADIVIGNPQLNRTLIQNYDLRFETFPRPGEIIALSAYYKRFDDPIITNIYSTGSAIEQQPNNVDNALVYGAEFEFRKKLDFISESLESFKLVFNASLIYSEVNKAQRELDQIEGFVGAESINSDSRPFQGQSPYIINASLLHNSEKLQWENGLRFNIWGRRLSYQTPAQVPDVYEVSRPSLDFTSSKKIGEKYAVSFKVMNILNMEYRQEFDFDIEGVNNAYRSFRVGTTFQLGFSYNI